jgi:muconolactone delta-isomerase
MEQIGPLLAAFKAWRAQHRASLEGFWFFAGGGGGCGIANVPDEMALHVMMASYPYNNTSHIEVSALVDGDWAIGVWEEMFRSAAGG